MANEKVEGAPGKIKTFVFFDLETLSFYEDQPRILELSMIAVSREHFRSMKDQAHVNNPSYKKGDPLPLPRVCHKYTTLYYPQKNICSVVEKITGLSNNNLRHLKGFDKESATSIKLFLNLPSPVAFVAHNGDGFDCPILKAELMEVHEENLENVVCVDSLKFLRQYGKGDIKKLTVFGQEVLLNNDKNLINNNNDNICEAPVNCQTPEKLKMNDSLKTDNLEPPRKKIIRDNTQLTDFQKKPYSQPNIFYRIYGKKYLAHTAEADAEALMQICSYLGDDFVSWADSNFIPFRKVKPRWV